MAREYLSVRQAAQFLGISYSHFRKTVQPIFPAGEFNGRLVYRRVDLRAFMEQNTQWPNSTSARKAAVNIINSTTTKEESGSAKTLVPSMARAPSRRMLPRRNLMQLDTSCPAEKKSSHPAPVSRLVPLPRGNT